MCPKGALAAPAHDMALPPPSIPSDLEPTQITTISEHIPQNDNAVLPPTDPSAAPQLTEPQRATPSMGSRCEPLCLIPWMTDTNHFALLSSDLPLLSPFGSHLPTPQRSVPFCCTVNPDVEKWIDAVKRWIATTEALLWSWPFPEPLQLPF